MTGAIAVRRARVEDADDLALAHVRAWQAAYRGLLPQPFLDGLVADGERASSVRRWLSQPRSGSRVLVGTVNETVVGFADLGAARDAESGEDGELYALNVHPDHWRAGVGSALLRAAHQELAALGHRTAVLWVLRGNVRACRFYERHGWLPEPHERTAEVQGLTVPEVRYARSVPG